MGSTSTMTMLPQQTTTTTTNTTSTTGTPTAAPTGEDTGGNETGGGYSKLQNKKQFPGIKNGWFTENETLWPGQKLSLALEVRQAWVGKIGYIRNVVARKPPAVPHLLLYAALHHLLPVGRNSRTNRCCTTARLRTSPSSCSKVLNMGKCWYWMGSFK